MDGISDATAITAAISTALAVIKYVRTVAGASEARQKLLRELAQVRGLLSTLQDLYDNTDNETWNSTLHTTNSPLVDFKELIDEMDKAIGGHKTTKTVAKDDWKRERIKHATQQLVARMEDLKWPFTESKVNELLSRLERIKSTFLLILDIDSWKSSRLLHGKLDEVKTGLSAVDAGIKVLDFKLDGVAGSAESIEKRTRELLEHAQGTEVWTKEKARLFNSISLINLSMGASSLLEIDTQKQSAWILTHATFNDWLTNGGRLLLTGSAGTGKSTICRAVHSFLRATDGACVVTVDFDIRHQLVPDLREVFADIVSKMIAENPSFQKYYNKLMLTGMEPLSIEDSLRIIHRARQDLEYFCIILEGIDAWEDDRAEELLHMITRVRAPPMVFATSRPRPKTWEFFSYIIDIRDYDSREDIRSYIQQKLELESTLPKLLETAQFDSVIDQMVEQSNGMFLWAVLVTMGICSATSHEKTDTILNFPKNLNEAIEKVYLKIADQDHDRAFLGRRLIQFFVEATGSQPTAKVLTFAQGISLNLFEADDEHEKKVQLCLDCCNGLVDEREGNIGFIHMAVRESLFIRHPEWYKHYIDQLEQQEIESSLAKQSVE